MANNNLEAPLKFWLHSHIRFMRLHQTWGGLWGIGLTVTASHFLLTTSSCRPVESVAQPQRGDAVPTTSKQLVTLTRPTAATLSADGKTVYVLAMDEADTYQLYAGAIGSTLTAVATSPALSFPVSIALTRDGKQLIIVDYGDAGSTTPVGAVYVGTPTGSLTQLGGSRGPVYPTAATLAADEQSVYVTGRAAAGPADDAGVWQLPLAGGAALPIYRGSPLLQPVAVTRTSDGSLYVADAQGTPGNKGAIFRIADSRIFQISKQPLTLSFPGGLSPAGRNTPDVLYTTAVATGSEPWLFRLSPDGSQQAVVLPATTDATSLSRASDTDLWIAIDAALPTTNSLPDPQQSDRPSGAVLLLSP